MKIKEVPYNALSKLLEIQKLKSKFIKTNSYSEYIEQSKLEQKIYKKYDIDPRSSIPTNTEKIYVYEFSSYEIEKELKIRERIIKINDIINE